jgi:hypothetical protein
MGTIVVVSYWLLVIGYWLLVIGCWLLVIGRISLSHTPRSGAGGSD